MEKKSALFVLILIALPLFSLSQKAYDAIYYRDTMQDIAVKFTLANGYIRACELITRNIKTKKSSKFLPEKGVSNDSGKIKFYHYSPSEKTSPDYFILEDIEEYYDNVPEKIYGKYYSAGNVYGIILKKQ
jgi:hypothetical protein